MSQNDIPSQHGVEEGRDLAVSAIGYRDPIFIYLYYLRFDQDPAIPTATRAYFCFDYLDSGHTDNDLEGLISRFAVNAHADGDSPPCYGSSFDELVRRRKGFIVVVVDAPDLKLDPANPIVFRADFKGAANDARHTLSDPRAIWVPVQEGGATRHITALYSANGMNEPDMSDIDKGEVEYFNYTLTFTKDEAHSFYPDSGGTNMGPPIGPPYIIIPAGAKGGE